MSLDRYEHTFDYAFNPDTGDGGFNSDADLGLIVGHFSKPIAPDMTESYQSIPGRYGGVFLGTNYDEKEFDMPVTIVAPTQAIYNERIRNLSKILINTQDEVGTEYPIRFNDDPDIMYYGHFTAIPTPTFLDTNVFDCETTLTFKLADPRGFLKQEKISISNNNQPITPKGDDKVLPVIHIIPKSDLYYFGYETNDEYVAVGYEVDEGSTTTDALGQTVALNARQTMQVNDPCNSMATWFQAGSDTQSVSLYRGEQDGTATSVATGLMVAKDSKGHYNWGAKNKHKDFYGPVIVHNGLPRITPYWKLAVRMHHEKFDTIGRRAMGKIETYLLDGDGATRGRMGLEDYAHGRYPCAYIQLGSSFSSTDDAGEYLTLIYDFDIAHQTAGSDTKVKVTYTKSVTTMTKTKVKTSGGKVTTTKLTSTDGGKTYKASKPTITKAKKGAKSTTKVSKPVTKTSKPSVTKYIKSYDQANNYNNFWGEFMLEHQRKNDGNGNYVDNWVASITQWNLKTGLPYSINTNTRVHINNGTGKLDPSGKYAFSLANIACFFGKHDITEDKQDPAVEYKTDYETLTNYQEWKTDGSDDPDDVPHVIAHAGEEIIIDTGNKSVTCEGRDLNKYVSWLSTFPGITGGVNQTIHFYPDPANCELIDIDYVPAVR